MWSTDVEKQKSRLYLHPSRKTAKRRLGNRFKRLNLLLSTTTHMTLSTSQIQVNKFSILDPDFMLNFYNIVSKVNGSMTCGLSGMSLGHF